MFSGAQKPKGSRDRYWSGVSTCHSLSSIFHNQVSLIATGLPAAAAALAMVRALPIRLWPFSVLIGVDMKVDIVERQRHVV